MKVPARTARSARAQTGGPTGVASRGPQLAVSDIVAGIGRTTVAAQIIERFKCSERAAQDYIDKVYRRWKEQNASDVPFRREANYRRGERLFAKAVAARSYSAAAAVYVGLSRQSAAFNPHNPLRKKRLEELGPVPEDPQKALAYARQLILIELEDVANNAALDPERRLRWISELTGKLGMLYSRAEVEELLARMEAIVRAQFQQPPAAEVVDAKSVDFEQAARARTQRRGPRPLPGPGTDAGPGGPPDGDDPGGGGAVG